MADAMERARALLGVGSGADADELRSAYRAALRVAHPDTWAGHGVAENRTTVQAVVAAYELLRDAGTAPPPPGPVPGGPPSSDAVGIEGEDRVTVEGDTVAAELPAGDLFAMLLEVGEGLGHVAFVDELAGLLEIVIGFEGHGDCSVVLSLQGRGTGLTEAFCTVEPLGNGPAPPAEAVAELLASGLRTLT